MNVRSKCGRIVLREYARVRFSLLVSLRVSLREWGDTRVVQGWVSWLGVVLRHSRVAVVCGRGGTHVGGGCESWGRHRCRRFWRGEVADGGSWGSSGGVPVRVAGTRVACKWTVQRWGSLWCRGMSPGRRHRGSQLGVQVVVSCA